MIINFSHGGLARLYARGSVTTVQMAVDRRCIAVMDVLASLDAEEPVPAWLEPACLADCPAAYCIPVSDGLFIAFRRQGADLTDLRLASAAFEVPGPDISCPTALTRPPTHPGIVFRDLFMPSSGLSAVAASRLLSVPTGSLFRFFTGERRAVGHFADALSRLSGTTTSFWTRIQSVHDRWSWGTSDEELPMAELAQALEAEVRERAKRSRRDESLVGVLRRRLM